MVITVASRATTSASRVTTSASRVFTIVRIRICVLCSTGAIDCGVYTFRLLTQSQRFSHTANVTYDYHLWTGVHVELWRAENLAPRCGGASVIWRSHRRQRRSGPSWSSSISTERPVLSWRSPSSCNLNRSYGCYCSPCRLWGRSHLQLYLIQPWL